MKNTISMLVSFGLLILGTAIHAADAETQWQRIEPFYKPPAEFAGALGAYRSPLIFNDGTRVANAADWARRRNEILGQWHDLMGAWPPLLDKPKLELISQSRRDNFIQHRVRVEISQGQMADGWLLIPDGTDPRPAVFVPYYEPETSIGQSKQPLRDFAYQLARRGFVTLSIGSPGGDARKPVTGIATSQPLSYLAYVASNCRQALANMSEVDAKRIGVVGHSYGGKWAMFASCLDEKFACAAWCDPGIAFDEKRSSVNYWEPWYLGLDASRTRKPGLITAANPRTGAYAKMIESGRDLHELEALMAPRPFLVSGGAEDTLARWPVLNHTIAVNALLGFSERVGMTNRKDHPPTEESNAQIYAFFEHFLKQKK
ncbi:MAG: sialidase [Planctomycetota bacterium]